MLASDLLAVADAVSALERKQWDIATAQREAEPTPSRTADDDLRDLADEHPATAAAYQLLNMGHPIVPLDPAGEPTEEPMRSPAAVLAYWTEHPDVWPGRPCGEAYDLVAASVDADGWEFLRRAARVADDSRPGTWAENDAGYVVRDLGADIVTLGPPPPDQPPPRMRSIPLTPDLADDLWIRVAGRKAAPQLRWPCWQWPTGRSLPIGRSRRGVKLLNALPAETALVTIGGQTWRMATSARPHAQVPPWLADVLGSR